MARARPSYGLTLDQILDFISDCNKEDLLYIVTMVRSRRDGLRTFLQQKRDSVDAALAQLEELEPKTLPVAPVVPE